MEEKLLSGENMTEDPLTKSHAKWAADIAANYEITAENVKEIVQKETGIVFFKSSGTGRSLQTDTRRKRSIFKIYKSSIK